MLRKISKICDILSVPASRSALFGKKPKSVASALLISQLKNEGIAFRTILDGGANIGQFARAALDGFPEAQVHSFEPSPDTFKILTENFSGEARHHRHCCALGSQPGEASFHCNSSSQTSSILPMNHVDGFHGGVHQVQTITVPVTTLDAFETSTSLAEPILLKLDLQGYELQALHGAREKLLPKCSAVLVEVVFEHVYEGEPLFDEIWKFLDSQGFRFKRPLNLMKSATGQIMQMDALFCKTA